MRQRGGDEGGVWLAQVQALWTRGDLIDPPDWVRERAKRLFRMRPGVPLPRSNGVLARIRAALVFDSRRLHLTSTAGVRSSGLLGGTRPVPWQLLYRGGDVDVDLLVRPNQDGRTMNVRGQALSMVSHSVGSGVVEAVPAGVSRDADGALATAVEPVAWSPVEPSGEFALPSIERGRYDVLLRFGAREIELSGVEF